MVHRGGENRRVSRFFSFLGVPVSLPPLAVRPLLPIANCLIAGGRRLAADLFLNNSRNRGIVGAVNDHAISKLAGGRPRRTYETGRTCSAEGCTTRLSSYNKNEHCWTHFQPVPKPARIPADN